MKEQTKSRSLWKPGQSGNPVGRPVGSRNKLSEAALANMLESWGVNGPAVLNRLANEFPETYARLAFSVIPKDVMVSVDQRTPANLDPDDWHVMLSILDTIRRSAPSDARAQPDEVFAVIEDALRSHFAKPVISESIDCIVVCTNTTT